MTKLDVFTIKEVGRSDEIYLYIGTDSNLLWPYLERFADAVNDAYDELDADAPEVTIRLFVRTQYAVNFDNILEINVADHCEWVSAVLRNFLDMERIIREELDMPQVNIGLEMKALRGFYLQNPFEMENGW